MKFLENIASAKKFSDKSRSFKKTEVNSRTVGGFLEKFLENSTKKKLNLKKEGLPCQSYSVEGQEAFIWLVEI